MLAKQIRDAAYLEGDFTTRSGKKTTYYIDKYLFETKPEILKSLAREFATKLPDASTYDRIAGPELGAVSLAAAVSMEVGKPFLIVKKAKKDYGTQNLIEGAYTAGERVVVLEDVITTGGAVLTACDVLKSESLEIVKIVAAIDRQEGAVEAIQDAGYAVDSVLTSTDLANA